MTATGRNSVSVTSGGASLQGGQVVATGSGQVAGDGVSNANTTGPVAFNGAYVASTVAGMVYNGAAWDRQRTPAVFKSNLATAAGRTTVWTPTAGKKFRIMAYSIEITADCAQAVAGDFLVSLTDAAATLTFQFATFVPGAAGATQGRAGTGWVQLGNGYLSSAANNVVGVNLPAALTSGEVLAVVIGTEE